MKQNTLAERGGFEPPDKLITRQLISSESDSAALAPLPGSTLDDPSTSLPGIYQTKAAAQTDSAGRTEHGFKPGRAVTGYSW